MVRCLFVQQVVEHEDLLRRVEERFGCISDANDANRKAASWSGGRQLLRKDLEQTHVIFGLPAPAKTIEDRFTLMALSTLYGGGMSSRLFQQVREKRGFVTRFFHFQC